MGLEVNNLLNLMYIVARLYETDERFFCYANRL